MKAFTFLLTIVVISIVALNKPTNGSTLINCTPKHGDVLLFQRHLEDSGSIFTKKHRTVTYPDDGKPATSTINCLKAIDNIEVGGGDGGIIKIKSGGVGNTSIVLRITSARGSGYNYDIELYGQKESPTTTSTLPSPTTTSSEPTTTPTTTSASTTVAPTTEASTTAAPTTEAPTTATY